MHKTLTNVFVGYPCGWADVRPLSAEQLSILDLYGIKVSQKKRVGGVIQLFPFAFDDFWESMSQLREAPTSLSSDSFTELLPYNYVALFQSNPSMFAPMQNMVRAAILHSKEEPHAASGADQGVPEVLPDHLYALP